MVKAIKISLENKKQIRYIELILKIKKHINKIIVYKIQ